MKYLKRFESKAELFGPKLIKSEAENYLPFLVDSGFDMFTRFYGKNQVLLIIDPERSFNWLDFKNDILAYLEFLNRMYNIEITIFLDNEDEEDIIYTISELDIMESCEMLYISIIITKI